MVAKISEIFDESWPIKILVALSHEESYISRLSKEMGCTHSTMCVHLKRILDLRLIEFYKDGRKNGVRLTDLGVEISKSICEINQKLA